MSGGCKFSELSGSKLWSVARIQSIRYAMAWRTNWFLRDLKRELELVLDNWFSSK